MSIRTLALCTAIGVAASVTPELGSARVYLDVNVAPPAAQVEIIPRARSGYVWSPGYYNWTGRRHVWVGGRMIRGRSGQHWTSDRWDQRGDSWHHERGRWDHN